MVLQSKRSTTSSDNRAEDCDLLIGSDARDMLENSEAHHLRETRIHEFYWSVHAYSCTVIDYLLEKLPLGNEVLKNAIVANPQIRQIANSSQLEFFLKRYPALLADDCSKDQVLEQFAAFQRSSSVGQTSEGVDQVWSDLQRNHESLSKVMKGILTIPHSSAACESVFSIVRKTCTEGRATMLPETAEALLVLKCQPSSSLDNSRQLSQVFASMMNYEEFCEVRVCEFSLV